MAHLRDDEVECIDEDKVESMGRLEVQADLEQVVVVRSDPEAGEEAVDHQVHVLAGTVGAPREGLLDVEQQGLCGERGMVMMRIYWR